MTLPILPPNRPKLTAIRAFNLITRELTPHGLVPVVVVLGVRGYFRDTMGVPGANDRGIYDDALFVWSQTAFASFNANTDPSVARKHMAVLQPGVWMYQKGKHKRLSPLGYAALVQAGAVTVARDEEGPDTGWFGINIHKGSYTKTSSEGCQTVFPDQWPSFKELVYSEMDRHQVTTIPYVLIDDPSVT